MSTLARNPWLGALFLALVLLASSPPASAGDDASLAATLDYAVAPGAYNNTVRVSNLTALNYPKIVADENPASPHNGTVYVLGVHVTEAMTCFPLVISRSFDAGQSFEEPFEQDLCLDSWLIDPAIGPNGTVYVATSGPVIYGSSDGGISWQQLGIAGTDAGHVSLTVDPVTGSLYVVWAWYGNGPAYPVRFASSRDGGVTWTSPSVFPSDLQGYMPQVSAYNDTVVVALPFNPNPGQWNSTATEVAVVSHDGGATFGPAISLSTSTICTSWATPSATVSPQGDFAIAWTVDSDYTGSGCWDNWGNTTRTWVSVSADGARTFSSPRAAGGPPAFPSWGLGDAMAFDSVSRLFVTWPAPGPRGAATNTVYVANSTDFAGSFESANFSTVLEISGGNSTSQLGLAPGPAGKVYLVWPVYYTGPGPENNTTGVFVRTITGEARGDVSVASSGGPPPLELGVRAAGTTEDRERISWTGGAVTLKDLPPTVYEVRVYAVNLSALAGSLPIRTWGVTTFTLQVNVSGGIVPPPVIKPPGPLPDRHARAEGQPAPFGIAPSASIPWIVPTVAAGGMVIVAAVVLSSVLHTRILREEALQRKVRLLMYEYIRGHPGASYSDVRDVLGLQNGVASYHLAVLERLGLVHSESRRRHRWYYPNGDVSLWRELPLSSLQLALLKEVASSPGIGVRELSRKVDRRASSVGYNVTALAREGVLKTERVGRKLRCFPKSDATAAASEGIGGS